MIPMSRPIGNRLVLFGPPCCGKGTLAPKLMRRLKLPHISTGEIFRTHLNEHSHYGKEIKYCMQEGKLVPDDLVTSITFDVIRKNSSGYLLDGFPRTMAQAEELHNEFGGHQVIHLDADDETIIGRLANRITCSCCGLVFNSLFNPPKVENSCDSCGGKLVKRSDDTIEVAIERLKTYHRETEPLIDWYRGQSLLLTIPTGPLTPDEIYSRVMEQIIE